MGKKPRVKDLALRNEIADMAEQGLVEPSYCYSVSLIPNRRPAGTSAVVWAKAVKAQITRYAEYIGRLGGILLGVVEPFPDDPSCPHFHCFVTVRNFLL